MYDRKSIVALADYIKNQDGRLEKMGLSEAVQHHFSLTRDRSVYTGERFSIRFCHAATKNPSNTVLSLSALQKYDDKPFIVCIVTPSENILLLANTSILSKISHSSQQLRMDNIKGSFNGSDIMRNIDGIPNEPDNFETLYLLHESFTFEENLERLVEKTNAIAPTGVKFDPSEEEIEHIRNAVKRAQNFIHAEEYIDLKNDLQHRINKVQNEIAIAAFIDNVNIRGRIIEYLITSNGGTLREQIIDCLRSKKQLPRFKTDDRLGDYWKEYDAYSTATEIKTKVLFLDGNPKGYNIDKLLSFLSEPNSVFMIYIIRISDTGKIKATLCSVFDKNLLDGTAILYHWAGRNSRGVTQFMGNKLLDLIETQENKIDKERADTFVQNLLAL